MPLVLRTEARGCRSRVGFVYVMETLSNAEGLWKVPLGVDNLSFVHGYRPATLSNVFMWVLFTATLCTGGSIPPVQLPRFGHMGAS